MVLGPDIQVGPLGGLAFWAVIILAVIGVLGGVTTGGIVVFVVLGALIIIILYFLMQRFLSRLGGAR